MSRLECNILVALRSISVSTRYFKRRRRYVNFFKNLTRDCRTHVNKYYLRVGSDYESIRLVVGRSGFDSPVKGVLKSNSRPFNIELEKN